MTRIEDQASVSFPVGGSHRSVELCSPTVVGISIRTQLTIGLWMQTLILHYKRDLLDAKRQKFAE
jgi:hypothetical protein